MPFGLREGFAESGADGGSASSAPAAAAFEVLVDAVLLAQPFALAGVAGEHLQLEIERGGDVEDELRLDGAAEPVETFESIHEIQMRDVIGRGRRLPLLRDVVRHAGVEAGVANQLAGHLVESEPSVNRSRKYISNAASNSARIIRLITADSIGCAVTNLLSSGADSGGDSHCSPPLF